MNDFPELGRRGEDIRVRVATNGRILGRSCESLLGICAGEMADEILNDEEIRFLHTWLNDHGDIAYTWPGEAIYWRVKEVLRDGKVSKEEREFLKKTLVQLIGGTLQKTDTIFTCASTLPLEELPEVIIAVHSFCFTGNFIFGTRVACERAVQKRGGIIAKGITFGLDYLVIGTMVSESWIHTTFGCKIEKAVKYRQRGAKLHIIAEDRWVQALELCAPSPKDCRTPLPQDGQAVTPAPSAA